MNLTDQLHHNSKAKNWKKYWIRSIKSFLGKNTLEVGSGEGANIKYLLETNMIENLTSLEPDKIFFKKLKKNKKIKKLRKSIYDLDRKKKYDCIVYADVLEHIKKDKSEIIFASRFLKRGGRLIVMAPANNFAYSEFDKAVGHYRRYNKKMLINLKPKNMSIEKNFYLDSLGLVLLLLNKFLIKKRPKYKDFFIWDRFIIPLSILLDAITFYIFGKTILCVFKKL
tara:strand:+ start:1285 stop:1959 length:675 start_codon:yes stop_codon:yes gene_type:complete